MGYAVWAVWAKGSLVTIREVDRRLSWALTGGTMGDSCDNPHCSSGRSPQWWKPPEGVGRGNMELRGLRELQGNMGGLLGNVGLQGGEG